jgi:hypothetical protein
MFKPAAITNSAPTTTKTWTVTEPTTGQDSAVVRHGVRHDEFVAMLAERLYGISLPVAAEKSADAPVAVAA